MGNLECDKGELCLGLNGFMVPEVKKQIKAWIQLILNLFYTRKGSYPSCPQMGIDLQSYEYEFMDNAIIRLKTEIYEQVKTYLPDIPLTNVDITEKEVASDSQPIMLIILTFTVNRELYPVVIATVKSNRIDFEVSM